ncbi:Aste57867_13407 [Aphanomyces stellatus]|uniref:Aste57867_13407 protein n=1 Tax=Aphanomyces stellatus TaxID=120398 RepID=A0A485KY24_9STRA|nr:hypothetical protein As57867_013357 [Aphanomyces stellatus]VFT90246.1 Aste57867_13407 [Aphanomyces stellatus]
MKAAVPSGGRVRPTKLEVIDEEIAVAWPLSSIAAARSPRMGFFGRLHKQWLTHGSREAPRKTPFLTRSSSDGSDVVLLTVVDFISQGFSIVCFEICRGVLVVLAVGWVITAILCVGVYAHLNQLGSV